MTEPPHSTSRPGATGGDRGGVPPDNSATGAPRWVKPAWIAALIVVVLLAAMMLFGGGRHGPAMHTGAGAPAVVGDSPL